jgi:hypothetical protein
VIRVSPRRTGLVGTVVNGTLLIGILVVATACSPGQQTPVPPAVGNSNSSSTAAASSGPAVFVPDGTAQENLAYFDSVNEKLIAKNQKPDGRTFIDNLVDAGFTKSDMEVTPDKTAIGLDRDNIQFAVKIGDECLIGQFGNVGYHSVVASVTQTDSCLIGFTRAINW